MTPPPPLSEGLDLPMKCPFRVMEKIPNKFLQGALTIILISFGDCFKFQSMSILSIHSNRQQKTVSMPISIVLAAVVQMLDSAIHRIDHYPVDKY